MNIYPTESALYSSFAHVALQSDRVWWNENDYGDIYKMTNLNLYKDTIRITNLKENLNENIDLLMNCLSNEQSITCLENEHFFNWSFNSCNKENLSCDGDGFSTIFELFKSQDENNENQLLLPFQIENVDDIILYNSLHQQSVKKLWDNEKTTQECEKKNWNQSRIETFINNININNDNNDNDNDNNNNQQQQLQQQPQQTTVTTVLSTSELNAEVPEFYPSVLLPPVQSPPKFPTVYDENYQAELFPFKDGTNWQQAPAAAPATEVKTGFSSALPASSAASLPNPSEPEFILLEGGRDEVEKLSVWLETVYPKRISDFNQISEMSANFQSLIKKINDSQQRPIQVENIYEERRLYRDVLIHKPCEDEEKDDNGLENKFEELEREALAQYRASDTSIMSSKVVTELSPELEQNLEREALEQYYGDLELEVPPELVEGGGGGGGHSCELVMVPYCPQEENQTKVETLAAVISQTEIDKQLGCSSGGGGSATPLTTTQSQHSSQNLNQMDRQCGGIGGECQQNGDGGGCGGSKIIQQDVLNNYHGKYKGRQRKGNRKRKKNSKGFRGATPGDGKEDEETEVVEGCSGGGCRKTCEGDVQEDVVVVDAEEQQQQLQQQQSQPQQHTTTTTNVQLQHTQTAAAALHIHDQSSPLKQKAIDYIKDMDINLNNESKNTNKYAVKQLLYKGELPATAAIYQTIKLEEIDNIDTFKQYAKELATSARTLLNSVYKRIKLELMSTNNDEQLIMIQPNVMERKQVYNKIHECLQLVNKADNMKQLSRKSVDSVKRELHQTIKLLRRIMRKLCALKDMLKCEYEEMRYMSEINDTILDIYMGSMFIDNLSEYKQKRIFSERSNLLLHLLSDRRSGYLMDRITNRLSTTNAELHNNDEQVIIYIDIKYIYDNINTLIRETNYTLLKQLSRFNDEVRIINLFKYEHRKRKDFWDTRNWQRWMSVADKFLVKVDLLCYDQINVSLIMHYLNQFIDDRKMVKNIYCQQQSEDGGGSIGANEEFCCAFCFHPNINCKNFNDAEEGENDDDDVDCDRNNRKKLCIFKDLHLKAISPLRRLLYTALEVQRMPYWPETNRSDNVNGGQSTNDNPNANSIFRPTHFATTIRQTPSNHQLFNYKRKSNDGHSDTIGMKSIKKQQKHNDTACSLQ